MANLHLHYQIFQSQGDDSCVDQVLSPCENRRGINLHHVIIANSHVIKGSADPPIYCTPTARALIHSFATHRLTPDSSSFLLPNGFFLGLMASHGDDTQQKAIHLTITESYAKSWGTWEGVREFIQNWYDGVLDSYETVSPAPNSGRRTLKITPVSFT